MRRKNALSVRVRNPTRGLVTRLPSEEADEMRAGDSRRVFVDAQNVRFEDGVVAAAPGYSRVGLVTPLLVDLISHWRMDEAAGEGRLDSTTNANNLADVGGEVSQVEGKIRQAAHFDIDHFPATLSAASNGTLQLTGPFTIAGWARFQNLATATILSKGGDYAITQGGGFFHVILFDGSMTHTLNSTSPLSVDTWYFIAVTLDATTLSLRVDGDVDTLAYNFGVHTGAQPLVFNSLTPTSYSFDIDSFSMWGRALSSDELDFVENDGNGLDFPFFEAITLIQQGNIIDDMTPKPLSVAAGGNLYEVDRSYDSTNQEFIATLNEIYLGTPPSDEAFAWSAIDFFDKEVYAQHDNVPQYWKPALDQTYDVPGLPSADSKWDGVESFFGHLLLWKGDRLKWSALNNLTLWIPVSQTAASFKMTVATPGFTQPSAGSPVTIPTVENPATEGVVVGQYISIDDVQSGVTYTNYYQVTAIASGPNSITGTLLDLTGHTTTGATVNSGDAIFSVDANDSGETENVGAHVNGPIYQVLSQGDYAYIFKERSIQSIQYVGLASGVFFLHPEIANEGLLSRSSLLGLGDGRMVFVGHREIYSYQGGPTLTPIIQQFSRQMYAELDRGRLDRILLFHKEFKNEVWIQYPVVGGMKVLIWNYREDSASIDIYPTERDGITAIAEVEWPVDPSWNSLADTVTWSNFDQSLSWSDMTANGADRFTLMATGDLQLVIHGTGYNRAGEAYTALAETQDFDCEEPDIFKYVDVVIIGLQVKLPDSVVRRVWVQLGYKAWLDGDVVWTTATAIQVQGNFKPPPIKINPGGAGRFLRLRFYSDEVDVPWRVTSYEIHTRPGSYY